MEKSKLINIELDEEFVQKYSLKESFDLIHKKNMLKVMNDYVNNLWKNNNEIKENIKIGDVICFCIKNLKNYRNEGRFIIKDIQKNASFQIVLSPIGADIQYGNPIIDFYYPKYPMNFFSDSLLHNNAFWVDFNYILENERETFRFNKGYQTYINELKNKGAKYILGEFINDYYDEDDFDSMQDDYFMIYADDRKQKLDFNEDETSDFLQS